MISRRKFVGVSLGAAFALPASLHAICSPAMIDEKNEPLFRISLAEWSLHRMLRAGELTHLDFPQFAKNTLGIDAVEYVNTFFMEHAKDREYLTQLKKRVEDAGSRSLLIMCDREGALGDADEAKRQASVENHHKWVEAAKFLGCHSIRVNAQSSGAYDEQQKRAADGLRRLCEFADGHEINVLVENHGGLSSNGAWLASVMKLVDHPRVGTLPDFGNFCLDWSRREDPTQWYDRYRGVAELMPFAKAVSAKSNAFDDAGNETQSDFARMMKIVLGAGYRGYVGIEYEGEQVSEVEGVKKTKALLERVFGSAA
jgi:L-ribulose-5-phosphate 3-epimerase